MSEGLNVATNREELFRSNTPIVNRIVGYYARRCRLFIPYEDIKQWGLMGLWDACCKYTGISGEFVLYAKSRIRGQILDGIRSSTPARRQRGKTKIRPRFELLDDCTMASKAPQIDDQVHARIELKKILEALNILTRREFFIISMYCFEFNTLAEIADVLSITEARVCQIKDIAVKKIILATSFEDLDF